jgi:3-oxoacyl-[acyl-carrier-protein] synthase II
LGDLREAQAIWAVFGEHTPKVAISATKSMTGHLMGAAGAVEGVATVLSVYNQCAPETLNYRDEDDEINLNVVSGGSRPMEIRYAMSDNIGLGGHNGAVIFKRYDGD